MKAPDAVETDIQSKRLRRTEDVDVVFEGGLASGWAFGVPEAFRDCLDILYLQYVDKERTEAIRSRVTQSDDGKPPTVYRWAWSRGVPPALNFAAGHVFYDPPEARRLPWGEALQFLKRAVMVLKVAGDTPQATGGVTFALSHYSNGKVDQTFNHTCSQQQFETFLRTGSLPEVDARPDP